MATITPGTYSDGTVLNVTNHNANAYSATAGRGVMSEANGGLDASNIDSTVPLAAHVFPEALAVVRQDYTRQTFQFFADIFGGSETSQANVIADPDYYMRGIPVSGLRYYVAQDAELALWIVNTFISPQRVWEIIGDGADEEAFTLFAPQAMIALFIDGVILPDTVRPLPFSAKHFRSPSSSLDFTYHDYTSRASQGWNFHVMQTGVQEGWRDIEMRLYLEDAVRTKPTPLPRVKSGRKVEGAEVEAQVYLTQGCGFGVTGARCVVLF